MFNDVMSSSKTIQCPSFLPFLIMLLGIEKSILQFFGDDWLFVLTPEGLSPLRFAGG